MRGRAVAPLQEKKGRPALIQLRDKRFRGVTLSLFDLKSVANSTAIGRLVMRAKIPDLPSH